MGHAHKNLNVKPSQQTKQHSGISAPPPKQVHGLTTNPRTPHGPGLTAQCLSIFFLKKIILQLSTIKLVRFSTSMYKTRNLATSKYQNRLFFTLLRFPGRFGPMSERFFFLSLSKFNSKGKIVKWV